MAQDPNTTRTFDKALNEDVKDFHLPSNEWTQARNAINNSVTGDLGKLGNEPGNLECASAPYPIIGFIHIWDRTCRAGTITRKLTFILPV